MISTGSHPRDLDLVCHRPEGKKTELFTTRHRHRDGTIIDVEIMSVYVNQEGKEFSFAFVRDITERKRTEEALGESEEKYRTLVEKSQDGIVVVQDERIAFVNGALMDMIGYSEEELLGHSVEEFVAPEDAGVVIARHRERMSGKNVLSSSSILSSTRMVLQELLLK